MDKPEELPRWAKRERKQRQKGGKEFDLKELDKQAQWPEDWRIWHSHGLELVGTSGRVAPSLFLEMPDGTAQQVLGAFRDRGPMESWVEFVKGRLAVGVGAEVLLKGLFLKRGFSIREPEERDKPIARIGFDKRNSPNASASFGTLLRRNNLELLGDPTAFLPLGVGKWWRDSAAHSAVTTVGDAGVHLLQFGMALRGLNQLLLQDSDPDHRAEIDRMLRLSQ